MGEEESSVTGGGRRAVVRGEGDNFDRGVFSDMERNFVG